jgi:hypothetical protein
MQKLSFIALVTLLFLAVAAPVAEANKSKQKSGSKFKMTPGQKTTVTITGTQGCKFEALHKNSGDTDPKVATVQTPSKAGKSQKVIITAVGPGETEVQLETQSVDDPINFFCNGFLFEYFITVVPDNKAYLKQVKGKLKTKTADAKAILGLVTKSFCDQTKFLGGEVKAGNMTAEDALAQAFDAMQFVANALDVAIDEELDLAFTDIWTRNAEAGFFIMDGDLAGLLPGGCGDWDKFEDGIRKLADKTTKTMTKKYKALVKTIDKSLAKEDDSILQIFDILGFEFTVPPIPIPVPMPEAQPAPVPKPLKKNFTSSGRKSSSETTRLHIGGSADPDGGNVTVEITGPGGVMSSTSVPVDATGCDWEANFPTLAPGSYTVKLTQGTNTSTFTTLAI